MLFILVLLLSSNFLDMSKKKNLSDFEKLLFATKYIEMLKKDIELHEAEINEFYSIIKLKDIEIGKLKSEIDELRYKFKLEKPDQHKLETYKEQMKAMQAKLKIYKNERDLYQSKYFVLLKSKSE